MSRLERFYRWLITPGPLVPEEQHLVFSAAAIGYPLSTSMHVALAVFFAVEHVPALAVANVFSIAIWLFAHGLMRRGRARLSFEVGLLEVCLIAGLTVGLVGWPFGMQYFLFDIAIFTFLVPAPPAWGAAVCGAAVVEFVALSLWGRGHSPVYALPAGAVTAMSAINELSSLVVAALVAAIFRGAVERAERARRAAHARTRALLHDVLPSAIADRLDDHRATIADSFAEASILFADIVGFTQLSQRIPATELVDLLNNLFTRFDELVVQLGIEKIKTVGDAYMVAAGVPEARPDHAEVLAALALGMRAAVSAFNQERGTSLQIRIGIHSGPVVAGVIGKLRFLYDLWGDSVNTASRMESHGIGGEVQVSEETFQRLRAGFELEERGVIEIKGKGPMRTYLLRGRRAP